ncbi:hypothetical protein BFV94_2133 [Alteromonas macleodii]|nr:hypothetical protein BFV94_2133 [Alteromonas macleodii]OES32304.1 hypothetical protein BFV93_2125 [Alteromonas macleodii]OES41217.1 hypothetical protein BFV96_2121 [Alteromonas macleodii]
MISTISKDITSNIRSTCVTSMKNAIGVIINIAKISCLTAASLKKAARSPLSE